MTSKSFSVRIYLQDGHTDGVKIIAMSKWPGRALVIPRSSLPAEKDRDELNAPGAYILIGPAIEEGRQAIYIGATDPVARDLEEHDTNKSFWTWMIVCASKDNGLTLGHIKYIEARLIQLAQEADKAILENHNTPDLPLLDETEKAYAESFMGHMLKLYPVLGLRAFESP
jgi:hypothetical protein